MKTQRGLLVLAFALITATPAYAATHFSGFGFSIDIPADWTIYSRDAIKQNPNLFNLDNVNTAGWDPALVENFKNNITSGKIEYYMHTGAGRADYTNNVNVLKQEGEVPTSADDVKKTCDELPGVYTKGLGRPINFYECAATTVAGKAALRTRSDGAIQGTSLVQYLVQTSDNVMLVFSGTYTTDSFDSERPVFEAMMHSIKWE